MQKDYEHCSAVWVYQLLYFALCQTSTGVFFKTSNYGKEVAEGKEAQKDLHLTFLCYIVYSPFAAQVLLISRPGPASTSGKQSQSKCYHTARTWAIVKCSIFQ